MKRTILLGMLLLLSGCSLFQDHAGKAHYTMEPVVVDGKVICCKVDIFNAKDIGKVTASATKLDDGSYEIVLSEEGVNSSAPMEVMAKQNAMMMEMVMQLMATSMRLPGS